MKQFFANPNYITGTHKCVFKIEGHYYIMRQRLITEKTLKFFFVLFDRFATSGNESKNRG